MYLRRRRTRVLLGVGLLVAVATAAWAVSPDAALAALAWLAADPGRYLLACVALAAVRPLFAWPTTLLGVAVGFGFGVAPVGLPLALALFTLTSVPPYLLARRVGGGGRVAAAGRRVRDAAGDLRGVAASRLFPAPSDVVSVGSGVAGVPPGAYLLGTAVGELPWAVLSVVAGASLDSLASGAPGDVFDLRVVAGLTALGLVLLAGPLASRYRDADSLQ
jgi:uncharacterized membrane protein YdjX (TVP38/TMEM64 family)